MIRYKSKYLENILTAQVEAYLNEIVHVVFQLLYKLKSFIKHSKLISSRLETSLNSKEIEAFRRILTNIKKKQKKQQQQQNIRVMNQKAMNQKLVPRNDTFKVLRLLYLKALTQFPLEFF